MVVPRCRLRKQVAWYSSQLCAASIIAVLVDMLTWWQAQGLRRLADSHICAVMGSMQVEYAK
jgi:hypothetical protein